ncbi:regulation of hematopoietic stem cell proliferation [Pristimantis euphronides]
MAEQNYKGMLIHHCNLYKQVLRFEVSKTGLSHDPRFTSYVFVNEDIRGEGQDKTIRAAENLACRVAWLSLQEQDQGAQEAVQQEGSAASPDTSVVVNTRPISSPAPVIGASSNSPFDPNYVGAFNEFCQRNKCLTPSFVDVQRGLSHLPEFFCRVVNDKRKFPEARGKNKKEAKKNAAQLALKVLKREHPEDLQLQQIPGLDDVDEAENGSESGSSEEGSSGKQKAESEPSQSKSSDSQITFHASYSGTPSVPGRPHRRIELAPKFTNCEPIHAVTTEDKIFLQDFDNITRLDCGGYGTVYKARKKLDKKFYVVKKVKRRSEKDENEIQMLAQLEHKNIVRYYHSWAGEDIFTDHSSNGRDKVESLFIQLEWCANGTLRNWIKNMETVDKLKSLQVFRQIVDGVAYIHSNNLIHRDLKPENILFAEDMTVKIADFGLVTPISGKDKEEPLMRTAGRGTKSYMAPEQENVSYENEVDIFPLGLILIELFWKFDNIYKEWKTLRNAELPPQFVQQFPSEEPMIKLMLSKEPKKRPKASYLKKYFEEKATNQSKTC